MQPMQFKDCGLGDKVNLYIDKDGYLSERRQDRVIPTTIIGVMTSRHSSFTDDPLVMLGWKEGEVTPPATSRGPGAIGNEHAGYDWIENSKLYMYRYRIEMSAECGGIITRRAERDRPRGPDLSDWRVWAAATIRPGECPCGGTRGVCPYHP